MAGGDRNVVDCQVYSNANPETMLDFHLYGFYSDCGVPFDTLMPSRDDWKAELVRALGCIQAKKCLYRADRMKEG